MLCPYANILGIPEQGIHAKRFMGIALNDTLMTIVAALLTSLIFHISILY
jgi:hypothetical protein